MALNQWMTVTIRARVSGASVRNAHLDNGKFHENGNFDRELSLDQINKIWVEPGREAKISSSGRQDAAMGTTGHIDLYDGDTKIGRYSWDVPWGSSTNKSVWEGGSDDYVVQQTGAKLEGPNLGDVILTIAKVAN